MKKYIFLILFSINIYSQNKDLFYIEYIHLKEKPSEDLLEERFYLSNKYFFEDENYIVINSCRGEFGGDVIFKSKEDSSEYFCSATCPVVINKINGNYFLSTSLPHMSGNCSLIEIEDPKELSKIDKTENDSYIEKNSIVGAKILFKVYSKTILTSFTYQNKLYHIVCEGPKIYIAERNYSELKIIQEIESFGELFPYTHAFSMDENLKVVTFRTKETTGFIEIVENKIRITTYLK